MLNLGGELGAFKLLDPDGYEEEAVQGFCMELYLAIWKYKEKRFKSGEGVGIMWKVKMFVSMVWDLSVSNAVRQLTAVFWNIFGAFMVQIFM